MSLHSSFLALSFLAPLTPSLSDLRFSQVTAATGCLCYNARITKLLGFKLRNLVGNRLCLHYARKTTGVSFRSCLKPLPLEQILQGVQFIWRAFWRQSSLWWLRMHHAFCGSPFKNTDLHKAVQFMEWQRNVSGTYKFNQMIPSYVQRACYRKSNS